MASVASDHVSATNTAPPSSDIATRFGANASEPVPPPTPDEVAQVVTAPLITPKMGAAGLLVLTAIAVFLI